MQRIILLLCAAFLFSPQLRAQKRKYEKISTVFSTHENTDYEFYDGFQMNPYHYYLDHDTLFCSYRIAEYVYPLAVMNLNTAVISEDAKMMLYPERNKIYKLHIDAVSGSTFPNPLFKGSIYGYHETDLLFPTRDIAEEALEYIKQQKEHRAGTPEAGTAPLTTTTIDPGLAAFGMLFGAGGDDEPASKDPEKILEEKENTDFEFGSKGGSFDDFKFYLHDKALWAYGNELYAYSMKLKDIDFGKITMRESHLWINHDASKCTEVSVYPKAGKFFNQDFSDPDSEVFEEKFSGEKLTVALLVFPDKETADAMIKYLKAQNK